MALFEKTTKEKAESQYLALLDSKGEFLAYISPRKGVDLDALGEALIAKGLNVEIKERAPEVTTIDL